MENIIEILRKSDKKLLQSESADLKKWSSLKHNKEDLNLLLTYNIAEIGFKTKDNKDVSSIFTSNKFLISILPIGIDKLKKLNLKYKNYPIKINKDNTVLSFDLIDKKFKTISLKCWYIKNFLTISEENVIILHEVLNNIFK